MGRTTGGGGEETQEGSKPPVPLREWKRGEERGEEREERRVSLCGFSLARKHLLMLSVATGLLFLLLIIVVTSVVVTTSGASKPLPSFSTGGDMLDFLVQTGDIIRADGLLATWYHRANNKSEMNKALASDVMILEADVNLEGFGTANQKPVPIMAHPPDVYSDNTLDQWLDAVLSTSKLDFKSLAAVGPSLDVLSRRNRSRTIGRPVWINADVLIGPNVPHFFPVVNATRFLQLVQEKFPEVTVSPGWKVGYAPPMFVETYTQAMVEEMYHLVKDLPQKVTFPVHALLVHDGWQHISWLLSQLPRASLTLWQGAVHPELNHLLFVRDNSHPSRVMYDIREPTLSAFRQAAAVQGRLRFYPGGDLLDYFYPAADSHRDPLALNWFTVSDRPSLLDLLSGGGEAMLVVWLGPGTGGGPLVEGSGRNGTEALSLQELLALLPGAPGSWGLYLRARGLEVLEAALKLLSITYRQEQLYRPVWVSTEPPDHTPTQQAAILSGEVVLRVEVLFPHVTLVLRQRSWPPQAPGPAGGWGSLRVVLSLDAAAVLPRHEDLMGAWSATEGRDLLVEDPRSREVLAALQKESTHTRVYYLTNQPPGCCD